MGLRVLLRVGQRYELLLAVCPQFGKLFRHSQEPVGQHQATQLSAPFGACLYKADEIVEIVNGKGHT